MKWKDDPNRRRGLPPGVKQWVALRDRGVCHICLHHGGDMHLDHIINHKRWLDEQMPGDPDDPSNLGLAHSSPCPTCGRMCHDEKTQSEAREGAQRIARKAIRPQPRSHPGLA